MSGPLAKAALVQYASDQSPSPVATVFQYNPESLVHTWSQSAPRGRPGEESSNPLAVWGMPGESFDFTIYLNADDDIVSGIPQLQQAAQQSGVGARLAAIEMMLYPTAGTSSSSELTGTVTASTGRSGRTWRLPNATLPVVLFYWNANRVVPVRVTALSTTETLYDEGLKPRHAQAQLSLRVLTPEELVAANPAPGSAAGLAVVAYNSTLDTRRQWAAKSTSSPAGSMASQLPH